MGGIWRLLRPGGLAVLSFPFNETTAIDNAYALPGSGHRQLLRFACRIYCRADIERWLAAGEWQLVEQEWYEMFTGDYWTVGSRVAPRRVDRDARHHFTSLVLQRVR